MNSPLIRLNAGASHHLPYTLIGLNLLWCLSRRRSDLAFLSSSPSYEIQTFSYPSIWFPHRLESEDHARPRFCPRALVLNWAWAANLLGPQIRGYFRSLRLRGTLWASQCSRCAFSRLLYPQNCRRRWKSSQRHFVRSVPWDAA